MMTETFMHATMPFLTVCLFAPWLTRLAAPCLAEPAGTTNLRVEITWGHRSAIVQSFYVKLVGRELTLADTKLAQGEAADVLQDSVARTSAGAGDVDGLSCTLQFAREFIVKLPSLVLAQATPRAWLEKGKRIEVRHAPTDYGPLSFTMGNHAGAGETTADIELSDRKQPAALLVRFRHPQTNPIQAASVNGQNWTDFDVEKEWVRIPRPTLHHYVITTRH